MRTRGVLGRQIVAIQQKMVPAVPSAGRPAYNTITAIILDDGTRLIPHVLEGENDYGVDFVVRK